MKINSIQKGFTVIELIVVIALMCILLALVLVGLNSAQQQSRDQNRITNIHTIGVALQQYFNACGTYPTTLTGSSANISNGMESCTNAQGQTVAITDFVPSIATYKFNQIGSHYVYASLATSQQFDPGADPSSCIAYHLGAVLEGTTQSTAQKSGAAPYNPSTYTLCSKGTGSANDFDGSLSNVFDLEYPMLK